MIDVAERSQSAGISCIRAGHTATTHTARPLVLVHGIGSNARSFVPLMQLLAQQRPTLAWDAPGYGHSAPLAAEWPSAGDYADALAGLLDRLELDRIDLLGHSLGALMAGRFAARHPDRVGRLFLASPALGYGTAPGAALAPAAANRLAAMIEEGAEKFAATRGPRLVYARHRASLVAAVVGAMSEVKLPGYAQASRMLSCADLIADAADIDVPTLVMVGGEDEVTPPAKCRRVHDALVAARPERGHRFEAIPDAGHAVTQEQPSAVARLVAAFAPVSPAQA